MSRLILSNIFLKKFFCKSYNLLISTAEIKPGKCILEIGAGSSVIKDLVPDVSVITSDVVFDSHLDLVCSAAGLPFAHESLDGIIGKDVIHHLPDVEQFLLECKRTLKPGAKAVFLEPYWGPLARLIFRHFHQEPFDRKQSTWKFRATDPWDSNQALPWIILRRDRHLLEALVQGIFVEEHQTLFGLPLLLSGGVFNRSLVPSFLLSKTLSDKSCQTPFGRFFHFYILFSFKKL